MRIEDELKTPEFHSEIHKAHFNVIFSAGWIKTRINTCLKPFHLTLEQFNVLRIVGEHHPGGIRVKDITHRMLDRNSNTTRIIDRLIAKNLLLRRPSDRDGRERAIILTADGYELLLEIDRDWQSNSPYTAQISVAEAVLLSELLDKLRTEIC